MKMQLVLVVEIFLQIQNGGGHCLNHTAERR
jgi:hypothetical protein